MTHSLFTENFKTQPYWWEAAPRPEPNNESLPGSIDVLVIGSGYTGLSAALQTARGGKSTLVVDANSAGWGCSSRNGGQVSISLKPDYERLCKKVGETTAKGVLQEGWNALRYIERFIKNENIDCDWQKCGRFVGAHNRHEFKKFEAKARRITSELELPFYIVPPQ